MLRLPFQVIRMAENFLYMSKSFYDADYMIHLHANGIRSTRLLCLVYSGIERFTANRIIIRALILLSR